MPRSKVNPQESALTAEDRLDRNLYKALEAGGPLDRKTAKEHAGRLLTRLAKYSSQIELPHNRAYSLLVAHVLGTKNDTPLHFFLAGILLQSVANLNNQDLEAEDALIHFLSNNPANLYELFQCKTEEFYAEPATLLFDITQCIAQLHKSRKQKRDGLNMLSVESFVAHNLSFAERRDLARRRYDAVGSLVSKLNHGLSVMVNQANQCKTSQSLDDELAHFICMYALKETLSNEQKEHRLAFITGLVTGDSPGNIQRIYITDILRALESAPVANMSWLFKVLQDSLSPTMKQKIAEAISSYTQPWSQAHKQAFYRHYVAFRDYAHLNQQANCFLHRHVFTDFQLDRDSAKISAEALNLLWKNGDRESLCNADLLEMLACTDFKNIQLSKDTIKNLHGLVMHLTSLSTKLSCAQSIQTQMARTLPLDLDAIYNLVLDATDAQAYVFWPSLSTPVRYKIETVANNRLADVLYLSVMYTDGKYVVYNPMQPFGQIAFENSENGKIALAKYIIKQCQASTRATPNGSKVTAARFVHYLGYQDIHLTRTLPRSQTTSSFKSANFVPQENLVHKSPSMSALPTPGGSMIFSGLTRLKSWSSLDVDETDSNANGRRQSSASSVPTMDEGYDDEEQAYALEADDFGTDNMPPAVWSRGGRSASEYTPPDAVRKETQFPKICPDKPRKLLS